MERVLSPGRRLLAVFCGGFLGTVVRAWLSTTLQSHFGNGWPYDILLINLTGAFLLAFFTALADATIMIGLTRRLFINVGFLGAYTTFSSLTLGDVQLFSKSLWFLAIFYLAASFVGGLLMVWLGDWAGQYIVLRIRLRRVKVMSVTNEVALTQAVDDIENDVDLQDDVITR